MKEYLRMIKEVLIENGFTQVAVDAAEMEAAILVISFTLLGSLITGLWKLGQWWWRRRQQQLLKADLH
ncbi:MAG: hypothetical protein AAF399_27165, partial [Bacteroidota bacterium]